MELLVDIQVSILGGHMVTANGEDLPLQAQVFYLHTENGGNGDTFHLNSSSRTVIMIMMILFTGCDLTMLSVLRPTAPAGRTPLGPCSNTAPSDLLVDHSQPPKRLVDSNTMTCK